MKIVFFILAGVFCLSMTHLFLLRFKAGDIYPAYSSLRSDPLGTKALFDALDRLDSVVVERNYLPLSRLKHPENTCLLILGVRSGKKYRIPQKTYDLMRHLADSGCRMVIAFTPADPASFDDPVSKGKDAADNAETPDRQAEGRVDLFEALDLSLEHDQTADGPRFAGPGEPAPDAVPFKPVEWPFSLWFNPLSGDWQTRLLAGDRPVIVEKPMKKGSLVLAADSYLFSNESLRKENGIPLLTQVFGTKKRIIFDEAHFGVKKRPGISTLVRQYNLYLPVGLLGVFMMLFIWKNATSLMPPDKEDEMAQSRAAGPESHRSPARDNLSGLVNLLKTHIPEQDLIAECKAAWKDTFVLENRAAEKYSRRYGQLGPGPGRLNRNAGIVDEYNRISGILSERK